MEAIEGVVRKVFIWFHNVAAHSEEASKKLFHWNDPIVIDTETVEHAKYLFWQCCRKLRHCSTLLLQDDVACDVFAVDLFGLYDYSAGKTPTDEHSLQLSLKRIEAIGLTAVLLQKI